MPIGHVSKQFEEFIMSGKSNSSLFSTCLAINSHKYLFLQTDWPADIFSKHL